MGSEKVWLDFDNVEPSVAGDLVNSSFLLSQLSEVENKEPESVVVIKKPRYQYSEPREHDLVEDLAHLGFIYSINIVLYVATQPETVKEEGSFEKYRKNFGRTVLFDNDREFWNWLVHPYSGSQLYLYFRANSYSPADAFRMSFFSSLLFEYTIEVYTEPASMEDLINTPILGSVLGYFFEHASMKLLNSDYLLARWLGHLINPFSLLPFFKEKMIIIPQVGKNQSHLSIAWEF